MSGDESDLFNVEDGISYYKAASAGVAQSCGSCSAEQSR